MKFKAIALLSLLSTTVFAGNTFTTPNTISEISAYSMEESIFPKWRGFTEISPSAPLNWNNSGCNANYVILRAQDQRLIDLGPVHTKC